MTRLLYLEDGGAESAVATVLSIRPALAGFAAILNTSPFYVKGGGQPSDEGMVVGDNGAMIITGVIRADGEILHLGRFSHGRLAPGDRVTATINAEARLRHSRLHTAGEVICAAIHELGLRWPVTAASHMPGQARVAFQTNLAPGDVGTMADAIQQRFEEIVARDDPVVARLDVPLEEARRLCPLDTDGLTQKVEPIRLVSPTPGFYRPCTGAHLPRTGMIGKTVFRKFRLRAQELSISYDLG